MGDVFDLSRCIFGVGFVWGSRYNQRDVVHVREVLTTLCKMYANQTITKYILIVIVFNYFLDIYI